MKRLINWLHDHLRTVWWIVGATVMMLTDIVPTYWDATLAGIITGALSLWLDRRNRSATRSVRAARDAFELRTPTRTAWIEGSRRFGGTPCPEHGDTCSLTFHFRRRT